MGSWPRACAGASSRGGPLALASVADVRILRSVREELLAHARRDAPIEACGLIAGDDQGLCVYLPCRNAEASAVRYAISPEEVLRAFRMFESRGLSVSAVFHSHPMGEAFPSATDVACAVDPSILHLIAAPRSAQPLRAFRIARGAIAEEPLEVV